MSFHLVQRGADSALISSGSMQVLYNVIGPLFIVVSVRQEHYALCENLVASDIIHLVCRYAMLTACNRFTAGSVCLQVQRC